MNYKNELKNNVVKNYIFLFINNLELKQGIWMIYLASKGITLMQLGILEGIFHITSFLMEVPTGAIADMYGRKTSRIIGRLFLLISVIIFIFANNFYMFGLSFIIQAISYNLESGAGEALIYDSLKEINEENKYIKINGNQEMIVQIASIINFALGGYLASKSYILTFVLGAVFAVCALIQAFTFCEPKIKKENKNVKNPLKVMKVQFLEGMKVIKNDKKVLFLILFSEITAVFSVNLFYYLQNYWKAYNYTEFKIGIIFSVSSLVAAVIAYYTHKIEKILKEKGILLIMPIISMLCIWGIVVTNWSFVFFILNEVVGTILFVVLGDYINKLIPSETRATVLSLQSMVFSFFMIIVFPIVGRIGDMFSLNNAFKMLAISATILVVINCYFILKVYKKEYV
ncbi:MFS transporter [Haloimpatiens sp. FM7330]|uniref:MFS transporter n=1 Tax=Haloimpatiens sp. FM7330 TaxID=3298610 RepID=UPI0036295223